MPNKLISMQKLRHLLRLHSQGKGTKAIASYLSMSRTTVKKYLTRFKDANMDFEEVLGLSDKDLSNLLQEKEPEPVNERLQILEKLLPVYFKRLKRKGVTRKMLFEEYREKYPDGYRHSRFCDYLNQYQATSNVVMHLDHKAGDKLLNESVGCNRRPPAAKSQLLSHPRFRSMNGRDTIGDKTVADAVLDRIVHRCLRVELYGDSLRKLKL